MLVGLKQGGVTIITCFNYCVSIARNCCKNAPTVSHRGNIKNAYLLRCDAVSLSDSFQNLLTAASHTSKKTKSQNLRSKSLECSIFCTLFYRSRFSDFALTFFYLSQLSWDNFLEFWSEAIRKLLFFPSFTSILLQFFNTLLHSVPLNVVNYGTRASWRLVCKPLQIVNSL